MRRFVAVAVIAILIALLGAPGARAGSSAADRFVALTNQSRANAGLVGYAVAGELADVAVAQAQRMAAQHGIFHNANLASDVSNWLQLGENVGVGQDVDSLHQALMQSPDHRANILSADFTEIGVGVVIGDDGRMYVSEVFRLPEYATSAPSEPAAAPEPSPAPEPAAEPTPAPTPVRAVEPAPVAVPEATTPVEVAAPVAALVAAPVASPVASSTWRGEMLPVASVRAPSLAQRDWRAAWVASLLVLLVLGSHVSVWRGRLTRRS